MDDVQISDVKVYNDSFTPYIEITTKLRLTVDREWFFNMHRYGIRVEDVLGDEFVNVVRQPLLEKLGQYDTIKPYLILEPNETI